MAGSPSTFEWLECTRCRQALDPVPSAAVCRCGGVLYARYRLEEAQRTLTPEALLTRPATMWRYAEVLPGSEDPVTLGEGMTPLLPLRFVGKAAGIERLYCKDESRNPTGSFKARGMSVAVTMARRNGHRRLGVPSAGNAGGAAAAYGALAGLAVELWFPAATPEPFRLEAGAHGAIVRIVDGNLSDAGRRMRESEDAEGLLDLSTMREPYRVEGKKTLGYELAEQFSWSLPDVIVYPTGGGTGLVGMWKAFEEMEHLGLVPRGKRPRMVAVQAEGCAPIVAAHREGRERAAPVPDGRTYASGLLVPAPFADALILAAIRESGGTALAIPDDEMARSQLELARGEGIFACPEGGAVWAAAKRLAAEGFFRPGERVVIFNTGTGLKYPRVPGLRVP